MKNLLILCAGLFLLTACSLFSPVKTETPATYTITRVPQPVIRKPSSRINLLVTQPEANSIYNTTGIAYTTQPYQVGYFVKSIWVEPPTQMLQPLIIQTLQKTHYFHAVGSLSSIGQYNFILNTQLVQLQQDFSRIPHMVRFILRAEILDAATNQILASKEFSVAEVIHQNDTYAGVTATNQAVAKALYQLAGFCVRALVP